MRRLQVPNAAASIVCSHLKTALRKSRCRRSRGAPRAGCLGTALLRQRKKKRLWRFSGEAAERAPHALCPLGPRILDLFYLRVFAVART